MWQYNDAPELYHHGILGQKWGVRRYQNKDGTLTLAGRQHTDKYQKELNKIANKAKDRNEFTKARTIPAGMKMYRTTASEKDGTSDSIYVSYLDVDRNHYKGGWIRKIAKADTAFEHEYTLEKDLKVPSREESQEVINNVISKNKKYINESVKGYVDMLMPKDSWSYLECDATYREEDPKAKQGDGIKKFTKSIIDSFKDKTPDEAAYMVSQSLGLAPNVKKEIISELSKKGYNAMVDEASVGGQNGWRREGVDPLIIFDRNSLKESTTKEISRKEENNSYAKDNAWSNKARRNFGAWSDI